MIVFGTAVTDSETYDRCALPGIRRNAESDSEVLAHPTAGSLFRNYNLLLDKAAAHNDLEALVLLHQDVELADSDFVPKVRKALEDPEVAIIGCAGSVGVRSIAWWQGALTWAGLTHRYPEYGGGDFPAISWRPETVPSYVTTGEVDSIDGFVMVLSAWAVRELRFDESLGKLHGYDFDICMQARAAGKKIATAPFRAIHHHSLKLINDPEAWIQTYMTLAEKWDGQLPDPGSEPHRRALRAEAEAACARAIMVSHQMREQAIKRQLGRVRRELEKTREQLEAARREPRSDKPVPPAAESASESHRPAAPRNAKFAAIDYAVEKLGVASFASLELGGALGQYAFYAIDRPAVVRGFLIDVDARRASARLLTAIEHAAERPEMRVLGGAFSDPATVAEIERVDAILLMDLLVRMVDPDWDRLLELYAPATSSFVIANPQWEEGDSAIRLLELGREGFEQAVPGSKRHRELFDRADEWQAAQRRPLRDGVQVWQWGITDTALKAKMEELGLSLAREWSLKPPPDTNGFINKVFVFSRTAR